MTSLCVIAGTAIGSFAPLLWGASDFSLASVLCGGLGGLAGLWVGVRLSS